MSKSTKKVFLFIVEGISDKDLLEPILDEILDKRKVYVQYTRGDITALTKSSNMKNDLGTVIHNFLKDNRGLKDHISKVIFLTDTDGCYILEENIHYSEIDEKFRYEDDGIYTSNPESASNRNKCKSVNLNLLSSTNKIMDYSLETYYFSCNLDHVFHNKRNLDEHLKDQYANQFSDKYENKKEKFITFFAENCITLSNEYHESWQKITENLNSLLRYSNFHLFFINNQDCLSEKYRKCLNEYDKVYLKEK